MPEYLPDICPACEKPGHVRAVRVKSVCVPREEVDGFVCDSCGSEWEICNAPDREGVSDGN